MPKAMEQALKLVAKKKGYGKKRTNAFIYGSMRSQANWVPSTQKKGSLKKPSY